MKYIALLFLLLPVAAMADVFEYKADGETRLYSTECYANTPDKIVPAAGGGYSMSVAVTRADCRVRGTFAKVILYKRDLNTDITSTFSYGWMTPDEAEKKKSYFDASYHNVLGLKVPTQHTEIVKQEF